MELTWCLSEVNKEYFLHSCRLKWLKSRALKSSATDLRSHIKSFGNTGVVNNIQCVQDGWGEILFLITDRRNIFWDFRGRRSSRYERTFWFLKIFFYFATMTFLPKIVRGDPNDQKIYKYIKWKSIGKYNGLFL